MTITIGIADSNKLFVDYIGSMINHFRNFQVVLSAYSAAELLEQLTNRPVGPDILLIDFNAVEMETAKMLNNIRAVSARSKLATAYVSHQNLQLETLLRGGCYSFIPKYLSAEILQCALRAIYTRGFYLNTVQNYCGYDFPYDDRNRGLTDREVGFIRSVCSECGWEEINKRLIVKTGRYSGFPSEHKTSL